MNTTRHDLIGHHDDTPSVDDFDLCEEQDRGYYCTEAEGHDGPHRAGDGETIAHAWEAIR